MNSYRDISEVRAVGPADEECLREVREVLARHGALDRFGLTLLHSHFEQSEEEVLVETVDPDTRTLTISPQPRDVLAGKDVIETSWCLDTHDALLRCVQVCPGRSTLDHYGDKKHQNVG